MFFSLFLEQMLPEFCAAFASLADISHRRAGIERVHLLCRRLAESMTRIFEFNR